MQDYTRYPTRYHVPIVLLLDKSGFMAGEPIDTVNQILFKIIDALIRDELDEVGFSSRYMFDLCIIAFGGTGSKGDIQDIEILCHPFTQVNEMPNIKPLIAYGVNPMARAVETSLAELYKMRQIYKEHGIYSLSSVLICITSGESTESVTYYNSVKESLKKEQEIPPILMPICRDNPLYVFGIGVGKGCNYTTLCDFFGKHNVYQMDSESVDKFGQILAHMDFCLIPKS